MDRISLLICGQIRDRRGFERDLERYLEWLRTGAVERIVFSGWISDVGAHSDLMQRMAANDIEVILMEEPVIKSFGYTLHQAKALHHGLAQFEADDWILKSRTDKVSLDFDIHTLSRRIIEQPPVGEDSPFASRVMVKSALLFQPFFLNDMMFAGRARDLRLIAHHDLWYVRDHCLLNTEQLLFFSAFRPTSPFAEAFFSINPGLQHGKARLAREIYSYLLHHPLYQHAIREFMAALESSFTLGLPHVHEIAELPMTSWDAMLDLKQDVAGTFPDPNIGLRVSMSNALPNWLKDIPLSARDPRALNDLDPAGIREADIRAMRDDLCRQIQARWPDLSNLCLPDIVQNGVRFVSTRISLVS
jgi:hypothetical protein